MTKLCLALAVGVSILTAAAAAAASSEEIAGARSALDASAKAYRAAPALIDTFTYVVQGPNMDREPKTIEVRLGSGTDASVSDALLSAVALGQTFYLTKSDAPGKYVARPFSGDFRKALVEIAGSQSSLFEPIEIALRSGRGVDAAIDAFRFNLLGPLHIAGFQRVAGDGGRALVEIRLEADNGRAVVHLDAKTRFVASVALSVQPPGAPTGVSVNIQGTFAPRVLKATAGVVSFDPGARRAVPAVADLDSETLPVGKPAPAFDLPSPSGKRLTLADLKGRAVVLDFWATWCVPCWKTLKETQKVADWAAASGLPVTVLAVNTMERFPTEAERKSRVEAFFQSQELSIPTLLDDGTATFQAFGSPGLPSMVLIAPDGRILKYHQGLVPDTENTLKEELTKALASKPGASS